HVRDRDRRLAAGPAGESGPGPPRRRRGRYRLPAPEGRDGPVLRRPDAAAGNRPGRRRHRRPVGPTGGGRLAPLSLSLSLSLVLAAESGVLTPGFAARTGINCSFRPGRRPRAPTTAGVPSRRTRGR